ncbi:MAG TPA: MarR family transcriptional regulator, partial [Stenomitos sp.]
MKDVLLRDAETLFGLFSDLIQRVLVTELLPDLADLDLTSAQVEALHFLVRHDPACVGDLADGLDVSYPAATKAVDRLVAKGMVTRKESERDRRLSELTVTEAGREVIERLKLARRSRLETIFARMASEDQRALLKGLKGFITAGFMTDKELIACTCLRCGVDCFQDCVVNQS